jgi:hypothetical protein
MKILLLHSPSTKGGTERIRDFLEPEIEVDFMARRPGNTDKYDGIILHNRIDVKPDEPTAIYPCGKPTARMIANPKYLARALEHEPKAIWTNSETATSRLSRIRNDYMNAYIGNLVRIRYMPKPFVLTIPEQCPPMPAQRRILWYWRKNWPYTEKIDATIRELAREVIDADPELEIGVISNKTNPDEHILIDHPRVKPVGRINITEHARDFSAMVRVSEGLDYGRVTYQLMAYGRWCLYVDMMEPKVISARGYDVVPQLIRSFAFNYDAWLMEERRKYIAENFSEEALSQKWQQEVIEVFG